MRANYFIDNGEEQSVRPVFLSFFYRHYILLYLAKNFQTDMGNETREMIDYFLDRLAKRVAEEVAVQIGDQQPEKVAFSDKGQKVYGIRGIAEYIGCSPAKAQNMKNAGILPFYEVGRRVFFYTSEVDAALRRVQA